MREAETSLRSHLRILQVARLEGWEVARHYVEVLESATEDPLLIEARRRVAKEKDKNEEENDTNSENESESYYNYSKKY